MTNSWEAFVDKVVAEEEAKLAKFGTTPEPVKKILDGLAQQAGESFQRAIRENDIQDQAAVEARLSLWQVFMKNSLHAQRANKFVRRLPCGFSARNEIELTKHLVACKNLACNQFRDNLLKRAKKGQ